MKTQPANFVIRLCQNTTCQFRFPAPAGSGIGLECPKCKTKTLVVRDITLQPDQRSGDSGHAPPYLEVYLDNIRSTFNVGAMFRTADGAGIQRVHLGGITPPPDHKRIHKTALGAEYAVGSLNHNNGINAIMDLKNQGYQIFALEKTKRSIPLNEVYLDYTSPKTILVVGNEIVGVDPDILEICDRHIHIPMAGIKGSLNVAIAFGIAVYHLVNLFQAH